MSVRVPARANAKKAASDGAVASGAQVQVRNNVNPVVDHRHGVIGIKLILASTKRPAAGWRRSLRPARARVPRMVAEGAADLHIQWWEPCGGVNIK